MIHDIIRHRVDYCLLALLSVAYIIFFLSNTQNTTLLLLSTGVFGVLYLLWGIAHHLHSRTLHSKVVLEYLLVSIFAVILVSTLLI